MKLPSVRFTASREAPTIRPSSSCVIGTWIWMPSGLVVEVSTGGLGYGGSTMLQRMLDHDRTVILWNNVGHPGPGRVEGILMDDYDLAMTLNVRLDAQSFASARQRMAAILTRYGEAIFDTPHPVAQRDELLLGRTRLPLDERQRCLLDELQQLLARLHRALRMGPPPSPWSIR